jgi:rhodanese-related sulfurtransferase
LPVEVAKLWAVSPGTCSRCMVSDQHLNPARRHPCRCLPTTQAWALISTTLKQNGVSFISPAQAARNGTPIVDIRPSNEFSKGRLPGAVNCQFYRPIEGAVVLTAVAIGEHQQGDWKKQALAACGTVLKAAPRPLSCLRLFCHRHS